MPRRSQITTSITLLRINNSLNKPSTAAQMATSRDGTPIITMLAMALTLTPKMTLLRERTSTTQYTAGRRALMEALTILAIPMAIRLCTIQRTVLPVATHTPTHMRINNISSLSNRFQATRRLTQDNPCSPFPLKAPLRFSAP